MISTLFGEEPQFLRNKPCKVYAAPVDVVLSLKSRPDKDTVVQPDVCVVCDLTKLAGKDCIMGAPDITVEVLSPSNNIKDIKYKFSLYEEAGVNEYWIVSPQDNTFQKNTLINGRYVVSPMMVAGDTVTTSILPGFSIDLEDFFGNELL